MVPTQPVTASMPPIASPDSVNVSALGGVPTLHELQMMTAMTPPTRDPALTDTPVNQVRCASSERCGSDTSKR